MIPLKCHISVSPKNRSRLTKKKKPFEEQTIVGNVSNDISFYYQWFLFKEQGIKLEPPPFGSHVTINNGKEFVDFKKHKDFLKSLNNKVITLYIDPSKIYRRWEFYCIPVYSKELQRIRDKLNLSCVFCFHITLGRIHPSHKIILPNQLTKEL